MNGMASADVQFIYLFVSSLGAILAVVLSGISIRKEIQSFEKRLVRIETFLMQCCKELNIHTDDLNG